MKAYVLYYDRDTGNREDWNMFYMTPQVFLNKDLLDKRMEFLKSKDIPDFDVFVTEVDITDQDDKSIPDIIEDYLEDNN